MANEIEAVDLPENNEEVLEEEEEQEEKPEKEAPKRKFTDEEQLAIHQREAKKLMKKLGKDVDEPKPQPKEKASSDLDYGQKAFLKTYGVQGSDELALVKAFQARTGDDLDTIVSDDIFLGKLNSLREARAAAEAVPKSTKRSTTPAQDDLSVAIAEYKQSGKLPDNFELRTKVVNAAVSEEKGESSPFSKNPVVVAGLSL